MEPCFYAIPEEPAIAFGRRVQAMSLNQDTIAWAKLLPHLAVLRRRPYLGDRGSFDIDIEPLARFDLYLRPDRSYPPLTPDQVPAMESEAFQWLLAHAMLLACTYRLFIRWPKFAFGWTITVPDERVVQPGSEQEEFDLLLTSFFNHPGGLPPELAFLAEPSHLHAWVDSAQVQAIVHTEARTGLLRRLAGHYGSSHEPITRSFGEGIGVLHHFLSIAAIDRTAIFMCYLPA